MKIDKNARRKRALRKLSLDMERDRARPSRVAKWLKLMESKKKFFAMEDEIDKITQQLRNKRSSKK